MPVHDARLNVRMPAALKAETLIYAQKHNMTVSQVVVMLLSKLIAHDKRRIDDVDQI